MQIVLHWIVMFVVVSLATLILGMITKWVDRKVTALVQWRVGPPWYQPFADVLKLFGKETVIPEYAGLTFLLAPIVGLAATCVAATMILAASIDPNVGFVGDVIVVLYLLAIPSLMIILGGSISGNPHGVVGASREMKLLLAYELPFVLAILAVIKGAKGDLTLSLGRIADSEMNGVLPSIACVLGLIISIFCIQAKMGLVPFDIAEAETEIMSGPFVEYSGTPLGVFYLMKAMLFATLPIFLVTIFWGGFGPGLVGWLLGVLKYLVVVVIMVLMRNTNPRVRIDHAMKFFWFGLTPIGVLALVFAMTGMP